MRKNVSGEKVISANNSCGLFMSRGLFIKMDYLFELSKWYKAYLGDYSGGNHERNNSRKHKKEIQRKSGP